MRKRFLKTVLFTLLFSLMLSINVLAAGFTQDAAGIHYLNDDGTYVTSAWVEVNGLWFLFDANGICINPTGAIAPDDTDGLYQIVTSYTPFVTSGTDLLDQCLVEGTVVDVDGEYFITPQASTAMRNANLVASRNFEQTTNTAETTLVPEQTKQADTQMVWLSATGSKYHSINNCGRMNPNKARQVSLEQAENAGYAKCSKCW